MMTYTPLVAGNLPKKLWLLCDGQQMVLLKCPPGILLLVVHDVATYYVHDGNSCGYATD